ncbi:MAG: hypothetical protein WBB23_12035 [Desulforhopalus sp.]
MKNFVAIIFVLSCGLVVLLAILATIDLEPYLVSHQGKNNKQTIIVNESIETEPDSAISPSEQSVQQSVPAEALPEKTFENNTTPLNDNKGEQEHLVDLPAAKGEKAPRNDAEDQIDISSSLLEMEITILPVGEYPYSILLETFTDREIAQMAIPLYQKRGVSAHWVKVDLDEKGIYYRLFTGVFATIPEAQQYLDKKQLIDKPIKPTIYSARIGVYQDNDQLRSAYTKISDTGVIPYILGTKEGTYHLYVGSFYTFIGAADQCRYLNDAGLNCEPVKRSTIAPL